MEHENGSTSCEDCPPCPPGQTLSVECGKRILSNALINCEPCKLGISFSSKHGTSVCIPCSSCAKDQVVVQNCTQLLDIKCDKRCYGKDRYFLLIYQTQGCKTKENVGFQKISIPPTTEGIGHSGGVGRSKTQEIPEGRGVGQLTSCPDVLRFNTDSDLDVQKSFLTY